MAKLSFQATLFFAIILLASVIVPLSFTVTWSEDEHRLTTNINFDSLPAIMETEDGRIWIVWAKAVSGDNTLFYKTSSDFGTTWSEEANLTYIPENMIGRHDSSPSIIQATNGTIWLVWASNRPYSPPPSGPDFSIDALPTSLTIPQGGSDNSTIVITSLQNFNEPVTLSVRAASSGITTSFDPNPVTPPPNGVANSTLAISVSPTANLGNHILNVLGRSENKSHFLNISLEITASGTATLSETSSSSSTSSAEDEMDWEIYYKTSNDNGATWSKRIQLTTNRGDDLSPSIVQLTNDTIMVVWQSSRTGNPDIFYKTSNGTSWSDAIQLTTDFAFDNGPFVTQARDGTIWVTWASFRTGDFEIFYKTFEEAFWSNATRLTIDAKWDLAPSILQTTDETIWIFWASSKTTPGATADIHYKNSSDNGATWSDSIQFTTDSNEDTWSRVTQASDARIWVVWGSDRDDNWEIYYKYSDEIVIHNVAITYVKPATSSAMLGDFIAITVVAENQGSEEESFEVSCYANSTSIGDPQVTSLNVGDLITLNFTWSTAGFTAGVYMINATASSVEGEVDIEDNTFTDGTVELMEPLHDVAVTNVTRASNLVLQGNTISINVTVQNQGTDSETFDVSCYVNSTAIGDPQTITLGPTASTKLTFKWDTSGFAIGNYVTSATASPVPDEDDTTDNTFIDGTIELVAQPVHDIAVINVTPSTTSVLVGQPVSIEVTVRNEGTETETFDITTKYDDTEIEVKTVTSLPAGYNRTEIFRWDTAGVLSGNYTISAEASLVPSETDAADNTFVYGNVTLLYRDVAITNVIASPIEVTKPEIVNINVTVLNEGELIEIFNVTTYYDGMEIGTQTNITLEAGANTTLTFTWDTTYVSATTNGTTYTISARSSELPYEANTTNNRFIDGNVTIYKPPGPFANFSFLPETPIEGEPVNFDASLSTPDPKTNASIISYAWDFSDGTTEIYEDANLTDTATHPYAEAGSYTVKLNVTDSEGLWDATKATVTVYRRDVAIVDVTAYPTMVVVGDAVSINVTVLNEGGLNETFDVTVYYDNTKIETQTVNNLLPSANTTLTFVWDTTGLATGEYVLKADASTVLGETDITDNSFINGQVTLGMFPLAIFTYSPSTPVVGETITFDATGSTPNGGVILQYQWNFGDGITGWGVILDYSYATLGTYNVTLTVTDSESLTDSKTRTVTVYTAPVASFTHTPNIPKIGETVTFNASSSYSPEGSTIVSFTWDFGDGVNGTGMIKTHTYTYSGTYVVTLTVKDVVGVEDTDSMTITVAEAPLPFSPWTLEILGVVVAVVVMGLVITVLFFRKRRTGTKS